MPYCVDRYIRGIGYATARWQVQRCSTKCRSNTRHCKSLAPFAGIYCSYIDSDRYLAIPTYTPIYVLTARTYILIHTTSYKRVNMRKQKKSRRQRRRRRTANQPTGMILQPVIGTYQVYEYGLPGVLVYQQENYQVPGMYYTTTLPPPPA